MALVAFGTSLEGSLNPVVISGSVLVFNIQVNFNISLLEATLTLGILSYLWKLTVS